MKTNSTDGLRYATSEVPVLLRLLQVCTIVEDPAQADAFVVPFPICTWQMIGWLRPPRPKVLTNLLQTVRHHLIHLNESTASRHVLFYSLDICFLGIGRHMPHAERTVIFTSGDDFYNSSTFWRRKASSGITIVSKAIRRQVRFNHSLTLPKRTHRPRASPTDTSPAADDGTLARPILLFGALDPRRNRERGVAISAIQRSAAEAKVAERVLVGDLRNFSSNGSLAVPSQLASRSVFCLCMAGDAPSFTQRFSFVIARGCIPVRIDPFRRLPNLGQPADSFPFPSLINWRRIIVPVEGRNMSAYMDLVPRLLALEPRARAMRQYMQSVAHYLLFDGEGVQPDAASAALFELSPHLGIDLSAPLA